LHTRIEHLVEKPHTKKTRRDRTCTETRPVAPKALRTNDARHLRTEAKLGILNTQHWGFMSHTRVDKFPTVGRERLTKTDVNRTRSRAG
jgi:hypothetical protein